MNAMFYKSDDASEVRTGLLTAAVFVLVATFILMLTVAHEQYLAGQEQKQSEQQQIGESPELRQLRSREARLLDTVEVIDSAASVYRIPIEHAMELIVVEAGE